MGQRPGEGRVRQQVRLVMEGGRKGDSKLGAKEKKGSLWILTNALEWRKASSSSRKGGVFRVRMQEDEGLHG